MAKPGAGKSKMQAQRKKQWNDTVRGLKSVGRAFKGGRRKKKGCYVATCVYGSYDCPQVWILRRFRDEKLESILLGRIFVSLYYALSPVIVNAVGDNKKITAHWRRILDRVVEKLKEKGVQDTPYSDDSVY